MIEVKPEPMPGNPAANRMSDKSGLWKVVIYDYGMGSVKDMSTPGRTHTEKLSYDDAFKLASSLQNKMNAA